MRTPMPAAIAAALLIAAAPAAAAPPPAGATALPVGYVSMVGRYRFDPKASRYDVPLYSVDQTMTATRDDPGGYTVGQSVRLVNGKTADFTISGQYDGRPHPSSYVTFAFRRLGPDRIQNDWSAPDGKVGREVWAITPARITIVGRYTDPDGRAHPFTEIWDRIPG